MPAPHELLAQLTPAELEQLAARCAETGRNLLTLDSEELAEWIDQAAPAIAAAPVSGDVLDDDWSDLEEFLDDTLQLRYQGREYRLRAADIDTGLECQMLLGVGTRLKAGRMPTRRERDRLEDAEETELFVRLLGGRQWLVEPLEVVCEVCDAEPGAECVDLEEELDADDDGDRSPAAGPHDGRGEPDPYYRPDRDLWKRLHDEGRSWAFVQHVGTTAIIWAAFGTPAALEYWKSGGRPPKAAPAAPPAPKQPADRKRSTAATTTRKPASGSGSPRKPRARKGTSGRPS